MRSFLVRAVLLASPLGLACSGHSTAAAQPVGASNAPVAAPRQPAFIGATNAHRVKKVWEVAAGGFGRAVAVSRALGLVVASSGSPVKVYRAADGKAAGKLATCDDVVRGGIGFRDQKLVVVCETGIRVYDGKSLERLASPEAHESRITAVALAWPRIAAGHHDGVLRVYSLDGAPTVEIAVPGPPIDVKSLALTRDGSRVAVAWIQGSIWWWDTAAPTVHHRLVRHSNESDSVAFNENGTLFAEEGEPTFTTVWTFGDPPASWVRIKNGDWIKRVLFTRDSKWLVRGGSDGLELAEIGGPKRIALDTRGHVEDVAFDELGATFAAIDRDGRLALWAPR